MARYHKRAYLRCRSGSAFLEFKAHSQAVLKVCRLVVVFRKEITHVLTAGDFEQFKVMSSESVLEPEVGDG